MDRIHKGLIALLLTILLVVPAGSALAKGALDGGVIFGDDYTLEAGETLNDDLVVFGGDVTIEAGASVNGSMAVIGGDATIEIDAAIDGDVVMLGGDMELEGAIDGDVLMVGGQISLAETALVDGDVTKVGGDLEQAPGATITGEVIEEDSPSLEMPSVPAIPGVPALPGAPSVPGVRGPGFELDPFGGAAGIFFQALGVAMVATLASLFLQPQLDRVGAAITGNPLVAGSFGLATVVAAPLALGIIAITLILSPLALVGLVALVLAWLFGMIALGWEVGRRFTMAANQTWAPALTAGFGAFLLMLVTGYIGLIPCVGWMGPFVIGLLGLGGTVLTVFGSRPYPRPAAPALTDTV